MNPKNPPGKNTCDDINKLALLVRQRMSILLYLIVASEQPRKELGKNANKTSRAFVKGRW